MQTQPKEIIIYDTEYWTDDGVMERNWNGLYDPPQYLIQIGAFRVSLDAELTIQEEMLSYIKPKNRDGSDLPLTPFFTELTKISQEDVDQKGVSFVQALDDFSSFCGDLPMYSYGYDLESTFLKTCFIEGVLCPFGIDQSRNVAKIFHHSGMSIEDIKANSSGTLAAHYGIELDSHHVHDARCDALSILVSLRHLIQKGQLEPGYLSADFSVVDNEKVPLRLAS
jgi:DNA polymerase III epsilon subunit-like protein